MNKYRDLFEKYVVEVGRAPHALTRVWVLGFCDWLARNESGLTQREPDAGDIEQALKVVEETAGSRPNFPD